MSRHIIFGAGLLALCLPLAASAANARVEPRHKPAAVNTTAPDAVSFVEVKDDSPPKNNTLTKKHEGSNAAISSGQHSFSYAGTHQGSTDGNSGHADGPVDSNGQHPASVAALSPGMAAGSRIDLPFGYFINLDLALVAEETAFLLLFSFCGFILALMAMWRTRMSRPAAAYETGQSDDMTEKMIRLETLVAMLQERLIKLENGRHQASSTQPPVRRQTADFYRPMYRDEPNADLRPAPPFDNREGRGFVATEKEEAAPLPTLMFDYHKLVANRLSSIASFVGKFAPIAIQPTPEAGQFREADDNDDCYVWAVNVADRDDYIIVLPGKEMIRNWSLLAKAGGSGAGEYLNGAYRLQADTGDLSIAEPAIASFDQGRKLFVVNQPGILRGAM